MLWRLSGRVVDTDICSAPLAQETMLINLGQSLLSIGCKLKTNNKPAAARLEALADKEAVRWWSPGAWSTVILTCSALGTQ